MRPQATAGLYRSAVGFYRRVGFKSAGRRAVSRIVSTSAEPGNRLVMSRTCASGGNPTSHPLDVYLGLAWRQLDFCQLVLYTQDITERTETEEPKVTGTENQKYVVTFSRTSETDGLRRMTLADAQKLVTDAAHWNYRTGRILSVENLDTLPDATGLSRPRSSPRKRAETETT
jgi:hypothetical protein